MVVGLGGRVLHSVDREYRSFWTSDMQASYNLCDLVSTYCKAMRCETMSYPVSLTPLPHLHAGLVYCVKLQNLDVRLILV